MARTLQKLVEDEWERIAAVHGLEVIYARDYANAGRAAVKRGLDTVVEVEFFFDRSTSVAFGPGGWNKWAPTINAALFTAAEDAKLKAMLARFDALCAGAPLDPAQAASWTPPAPAVRIAASGAGGDVRWGWTGWNRDESTDAIDGKHLITIGPLDAEGSVSDEVAMIVHRTADGAYPLDGESARAKELRAAQIVNALNADEARAAVVASVRRGSHWDEDPAYPVADWKYEVAGDHCRLGYWDWVEHQSEQDAIAAEDGA